MVVLVMGVAGSGKTLIGSMLAAALGWNFADGDDFHPAGNLSKMARGIPLTDSDREPWLNQLHGKIVEWTRSGENVVLACSALKQRYREQLAGSCPLTIVFLKGNFELIHSRVAARQAHFMRPEMLASQFADLEEPANAITIDVTKPANQIVKQIQELLLAMKERN